MSEKDGVNLDGNEPDAVEAEEVAVLPTSEVELATDESISDDATISEDVPNGDDSTDGGEPTGNLTLKYGDEDVDVAIPEDISSFLKTNNFDAAELAKELYDGEFGLKEETISKLYKAYGKSLVDGYIEGIKLKNDSIFAQVSQAKQAKEAADSKVWDETLTSIGGEENWGKLEEFALAELSDEELAEFNTIMTSGVRYSQKLAIKDIQARYLEKNGTGLEALVSGDSSEGGGGDVALSRQAYQDLITSGEYRKNPQKFDSLRRLGMQRGI